MKILSKISTLILICLMSQSAIGQDVSYLDKDGKPCREQHAVFQRNAEMIDFTPTPGIYDGLSNYEITDYYYPSKTLAFKGHGLKNLNSFVYGFGYTLNDEATYYHRNGKIKTHGYYKIGKKQGIFRYFDQQGKLIKSEEYNNGILIGNVTDNSLNNHIYMPLVGKWENNVVDNSFQPSSVKVIKREATFETTGMLRILYSEKINFQREYQWMNSMTREHSNTQFFTWKYHPQSNSSGILEQYEGSRMVCKSVAKWYGSNKVEFTVIQTDLPGVQGKSFTYTKVSG
ncbi:toxin-antitoxin system YwqK family antitoxin [Phaeodactylibacter xiamenensis]|uniref:toxin-antitoxin system YwqK family antitoxin n=1 Tax=Phaeodactylibacter xiamenensis TaxID=1524460 RepID=UPI003CCB7B73